LKTLRSVTEPEEHHSRREDFSRALFSFADTLEKIGTIERTIKRTQFQEAVEVHLNLAETHVRMSADLIGILAQPRDVDVSTVANNAILPTTKRLAIELKKTTDVESFIKAQYPALWEWLGGEIPAAQALKDKYVETIKGSDVAFSDPRFAPAHWAGLSLNEPALDFDLAFLASELASEQASEHVADSIDRPRSAGGGDERAFGVGMLTELLLGSSFNFGMRAMQGGSRRRLVS